MLDWRIYYSDGSVFDSSMGLPGDAPGYGVVCIVQSDTACGRTILRRWDWYYWSPSNSQWWGSTDIHSVLDHILNRTEFMDPYTLCQARHAINYEEIIAMAVSDPDFPVRSAISKAEVPTHS